MEKPKSNRIRDQCSTSKSRHKIINDIEWHIIFILLINSISRTTLRLVNLVVGNWSSLYCFRGIVRTLSTVSK
jgi:hypothetical protein